MLINLGRKILVSIMSEELAKKLLAQVYASAPSDCLMFRCLELLHPAFSSEFGGDGAIRLVNYRLDPLDVRLETGVAARFYPAAFDVKLPAKSVRGQRALQIVLDAVSVDVIEQLERVSDYESRERIRVVYREYAENMLDYPGRVESGFTLVSPRVAGVRAQASAVYKDTLNKSVPSILYTLDTHPGLANVV